MEEIKQKVVRHVDGHKLVMTFIFIAVTAVIFLGIGFMAGKNSAGTSEVAVVSESATATTGTAVGTATASDTAPSPISTNSTTDIFTTVKLKSSYHRLDTGMEFKLEDGQYTSGADTIVMDETNIAKYKGSDGSYTQAAVILTKNDGGTGKFKYLEMLMNKGGSPIQISTVLLGDRVQVEEISFTAENVIQVKMLGFKSTDPSCCPSEEQTKTFELTYGDQVQLIEK